MGFVDMVLKATGREIPEKIKMGNDMYRYCCYYQKSNPYQLDVMGTVEDLLEADEYVCHCFEGDRVSEKVQRAVFYAFTDRRIMFGAGKDLFLPVTELTSFFKIVMYEDISEVKISDNTIIIKFEEKEEQWICRSAESIAQFKKRALPLIQRKYISEKKESNLDNPIIEIRKYKELLDEGIITEEEFQKKKKELLNL